MKKHILTILSALFIFSCTEFEDDVTELTISSGSADFSAYVALGNSLTAGYLDGALPVSGQENSYPAIIAQEMQRAGGGNFLQPLMNDDLGGIPALGIENKLELQVVNGSLAPVRVSGTASNTIDNIYANGPYNNLGVPGAKSYHLVASGYGSAANLATGAANPYYVRFASTAGANVVADALAMQPTFFTLWIGANDVLGYATSGGSGVDQTGNLNAATWGSNDISDPAFFGAVYSQIVDAITSGGAKGIVLSVPDVTNIPYFTTVPYNAIPLDAATATSVNAAYALYNAGMDQIANLGMISVAEANARKISFSEGQNAPVITDNDLTDLSGLMLPSIRQATENDLLLLTSSSVIGKLADPNNPASAIGIGVPLDNQYALTAVEAQKIATATAAYNTVVESIANAKDLAFLDVNNVLSQLNTESGIIYNGVNYTSTFVTGGTFSLDGVHPNSRGYAMIANEIIQTINAKYGSTLGQVDVNSYPGVAFP